MSSHAKGNSRFHCLLPVRDEADIIGQCLTHLLTWADAVYVFDTGSVDETWEIVQSISQTDRRIIPLRKDPVYFTETRLRGWMFHQARQNMRPGDWFLRVDADEFHHIPPPEFVKTRLRPHETLAYHQYYDFVLRNSEAQAWNEGRETVEDRSRPIKERRQWYRTSTYAEPRLCRYRETMQWPPTVSFPFNAGFVAQERIPIRHYPHRDPDQLMRRCLLRAIMMADPENRSHWSHPESHHWAEREWQKFITPDDTPSLKQWIPGTALAEVRQTNHLAQPPLRLAQRLTHALLLPFLDRSRQGWPKDSYPQIIPTETISQLETQLRVEPPSSVPH